jgi:peptide/nickel transport system permease protein
MDHFFTVYFPFFLVLYAYFKKLKQPFFLFLLVQFGLFFPLMKGIVKDPASDPVLNKRRQEAIQKGATLTFEDDLKSMPPYGRVLLLVRHQQRLQQHLRLIPYESLYIRQNGGESPTLWNVDASQPKTPYLLEKEKWISTQKLNYVVWPLIRDFHWEEDAAGSAALNRVIPFTELTRINRKDLVSALIFGVRISLVVGVTAVLIALLIGVPVGALAGYYGGRFDIVTCRLLEIWETMPTFFMLLFIVAMTASKSIFLVIFVIGVFGWTSFSRYIRGEFLKQRNLSYVEAGHAMGFSDFKIIFSHILPNAIPPLLTLLPFAVMGAITSEAGLSFLGLGEEGSTSWGVLMDEGRQVFPGESYLLWPPAILLVILLTAIALVGDSLRDTLDPKAV